MNCINDTIPYFRTILSKITSIKKDWIINGESIRGPELVKVSNGQKIPFSPDDNFIVFYLDYDNSIAITEVEDDEESVQTYLLHLIIYGRDSRRNMMRIKNKFYDPIYLEGLASNGIGLIRFENANDISDFVGSGTYILRTDLSILFNVVIEDDKEDENVIDNGEISLTENNI